MVSLERQSYVKIKRLIQDYHEWLADKPEYLAMNTLEKSNFWDMNMSYVKAEYQEEQDMLIKEMIESTNNAFLSN